MWRSPLSYVDDQRPSSRPSPRHGYRRGYRRSSDARSNAPTATATNRPTNRRTSRPTNDGPGAGIPAPKLRPLPAGSGPRKRLLSLRHRGPPLSGFHHRHWGERARPRAPAPGQRDSRTGGAADPLLEPLLSPVPGPAGQAALG